MKQATLTPLPHDELFKEVLRVCFVDFIELFLPEVRQYLDENSIVFNQRRKKLL